MVAHTGRGARFDRGVRVLRTTLGWAVLGAVLTLAWLLLVVHLPRSDFVVFYQAGRDALTGRDPYPALGSAPVLDGHAFVYPWLFSSVFAPFALLPWPAADVAYFVASGAAVVVGCRALGARDPVSVLIVLTAATTFRGFQVGSLNPLLFLGCALAWRYRNRPGVAGWLLALVVGSKLFLLPLLGWPLLARRRRVLIGTVAVLVVLFAASFALGPISAPSYARLVATMAQREGVQGFSLFGLVTRLAGPTAAHAVCLGLAALLLANGWWAHRRWGARAEPAVFASCLVASLFSTPVLWSHYLLLGFLPLLVAGSSRLVLLCASLVSWAVAPPVDTPAWHGLSWPANPILLQGGLLASVVLVTIQSARSTAPGPRTGPGPSAADEGQDPRTGRLLPV